jgi:prolyl-tRNA synthetase
MIHSDDKGLVLPPKVAQTQVVIIPIFTKKDNQPLIDKCYKI